MSDYPTVITFKEINHLRVEAMRRDTLCRKSPFNILLHKYDMKHKIVKLFPCDLIIFDDNVNRSELSHIKYWYICTHKSMVVIWYCTYDKSFGGYQSIRACIFYACA